MFDIVGIGLNAIDYLVSLPRFPVPGEKLRMSAFAREGGGQVATALVALSRWGRAGAPSRRSRHPSRDCRGMGGRAAIPTIEAIRAAGASPGR